MKENNPTPLPEELIAEIKAKAYNYLNTCIPDGYHYDGDRVYKALNDIATEYAAKLQEAKELLEDLIQYTEYKFMYQRVKKFLYGE